MSTILLELYSSSFTKCYYRPSKMDRGLPRDRIVSSYNQWVYVYYYEPRGNDFLELVYATIPIATVRRGRKQGVER